MRESLASPNDRLRTVAYSFFEHNPDRAMVPQLLAALDKEQAEFVRPALVRALAALRRAGRRRRACAPGAGARGRARRRLLPQRRHRGARRLQGAVRLRRADRRSPSSTARCRTMRRWRSARSATSARSRRWPALQRTAPRRAAVDRGGDLPARRQLRVARELSDRDAEVRGQEPRLPGTAARRRGRPRRAGASPATPKPRDALFEVGIPSRRSDPRAGGAGAGDRRAAQHAADADVLEKHPDREQRDRAARRRLRHARGGSRQGALLRVRAPHLLGRRRRVRRRAR